MDRFGKKMALVVFSVAFVASLVLGHIGIINSIGAVSAVTVAAFGFVAVIGIEQS